MVQHSISRVSITFHANVLPFSRYFMLELFESLPDVYVFAGHLTEFDNFIAMGLISPGKINSFQPNLYPT